MKITLKNWIKNEEEKLRNFNDLNDEDDEYDLFDEDEDDDDGSTYSTLIRMPKEEFAEILLNIESSMAERCIDQFKNFFNFAISSLLEDAHSTVIHYLIKGFYCEFGRESRRWSAVAKCKWLDSPWDNKYIDMETDDTNLITFERAFEKLERPSVFEATRKMTKGELALFSCYMQEQGLQPAIKALQESITVVGELFPKEEKELLKSVLAVMEKWANRVIKSGIRDSLNWYDEPWE